MKKFYLTSFILLSLLTFPSCDQSLNPKADYYERYALNCILSGDTTYQVAVISHSYDVAGYDPYVNTTDPAVTGADLRLWYEDSVFVFRDSIVSRSGDPRYNDSLRIYYLKNVHIDFNKPIEIEALLPNGRRLSSSTTSAKEIIFDDRNSTKVIPPVNTPLINIYWNMNQSNGFYFPVFKVTYYKRVNGEQEKHIADIPLRFNQENGESVPVYPSVSRQSSIVYDPDVIRQVLMSISEGDPDKSNYSILIDNPIKVYSLDPNLERYYSSTTQDNNFTVRLDENDFSNITGGFGVFGSYVIKDYNIRFTPEFITELGYNPVY